MISLLLLSPNSNFCLFFLDQLDKRILTEEDFYEKGENPNYLLFRLFFEKYGELLKNLDIYQGNDISNIEVKYNVINYLMDKDEDNSFCQKIFVIFDDEKKAIKFINR